MEHEMTPLEQARRCEQYGIPMEPDVAKACARAVLIAGIDPADTAVRPRKRCGKCDGTGHLDSHDNMAAIYGYKIYCACYECNGTGYEV